MVRSGGAGAERSGKGARICHHRPAAAGGAFAAGGDAIYWLYGQLLGEPFEQNVQGTVLYDVRDTGQDVASGARFSVTSYESSFHTDNSFGDAILDYVGLLCLKSAKSGGVSQNVSGLAAVEVLRSRASRRCWRRCRCRGMWIGGAESRKGIRRRCCGRLWRGKENELILRYLRYWIEVGHEKVDQPLTAEQRRARWTRWMKC